MFFPLGHYSSKLLSLKVQLKKYAKLFFDPQSALRLRHGNTKVNMSLFWMIFPWDKAEQYDLPPLKVVLCALKKLSKATGVQVKPGAARDSAECEGKQKQRENDEVRGE